MLQCGIQIQSNVCLGKRDEDIGEKEWGGRERRGGVGSEEEREREKVTSIFHRPSCIAIVTIPFLQLESIFLLLLMMTH